MQMIIFMACIPMDVKINKKSGRVYSICRKILFVYSMAFIMAVVEG